MTKEEKKKIIRENQDKSLNELKTIIKSNLQKGEREKFTFDELMQLITEINQEREKDIQKVSSNKSKNIREIEGEKR